LAPPYKIARTSISLVREQDTIISIAKAGVAAITRTKNDIFKARLKPLSYASGLIVAPTSSWIIAV
jgi:hypothetical protein